jgi:hypothetical protein
VYIWSSPLILNCEDERLDAAEDHDDHDDGEDPDQEGEGQPPRGQQEHASGYRIDFRVNHGSGYG